jgi:hypothetical protein
VEEQPSVRWVDEKAKREKKVKEEKEEEKSVSLLKSVADI